MFLDKRAKEVEKLMLEQFDQVDRTLREVSLVIREYCQNDKSFKKNSFEVHQMEHKADKVRRRIGVMLSAGAYLPVYREHYFKLVRLIDEIANQAEVVGDFITLTRPLIPDFLEEKFCELIDMNLETFDLLKHALVAFLEGEKEQSETTRAIRHRESDVDTLQFHMTRILFKSNLDKIEKLHTKELIDKISNISDFVEDVSDHFEILAAIHRM